MKISMIRKTAMPLRIISEDGTHEDIVAEPRCGEDFCDECGDCLHCFGGDKCAYTKDGFHVWIMEDQE